MKLADRQRTMKQRMRKRRCNTRFSIVQEEHMRRLRLQGWTFKEIGQLYECAAVTVLYIVKRQLQERDR